jgi:hypothetical protein
MPKLFGKIFSKDNAPQASEKTEAMLSLSISAGVVKASVWELQDHTIEITGLGVKTYSEAGREKDIDYKNLLEKTADAIDIACQVAETDVKKTIFGLPQVWIENEQLLPEYDDMMEKLAKTLDLESVAYVSIPHAISYYLQYLHKTAPTAILIGSSREGAYLSYVENGKIKESHYVSWAGGSLGKNIDKGLLQFKTLTNFPSVMCLYGYGDLIAARNELAKYAWSAADRLGEGRPAPTFVANPKIMVLEEHVDALAVSLVGGKDFAKQHNIQGRLQIKSLEYRDMNTNALAVENEAALLPTVVESLSTEASIVQQTAAHISDAPFGFIMNKDITKHTQEILSDEEPSAHTTEEIDDTLKEDEVDEVSHTNTESEEIELGKTEEENHTAQELGGLPETEEEFEEKHPQYDKPWEESKKESRFAFTPPALPKSKLFANRSVKQIAIGAAILGIILLLLSGGAAWAYWNVPKAKVTVYVKPENLEKQLTVTANEKSTVSNDNNTLPATKISIELKETKSADTTGKRQTGQVAKGTVTIYNKTGSEKTFTSGSEIVGPNNRKFTLSENVSVASASAQSTDGGENKTYGKANVNVTAVDIGPEGNLSKDTSLAISPFTKDDFEAKAASDFTGGSKKDVQVVSAADRNNLAKELRSEMQNKIATTLREKVSSDQILLDNAWNSTTSTEKFDKNVNDESAKVTVDTTMKVDGYVIAKSDVEKLLANSSTAAVPEGYDLKDKNTGVRTTFVSLDKSGTLTFTAATAATIIPKLNEKEIAHAIVGKNEQAAIETIKANSKVFDVTVDYSMTLPGFLQTLPHVESNIEVKRGVR